MFGKTTGSLTEKWAAAKLKGIQEILDKNGISETGTLRKSLKMTLVKNNGKTELKLYSVFYGKYVRAYYLKKKGLDIFEPSKSYTVKQLISSMTAAFAQEVVGEVREMLKEIKNK